MDDPLDTTIIEALIAELGSQSIATIFDLMAGDADRLLTGLQQAQIAGDDKSFRLCAHSLKSNAQTVGAVAVGELFAELEEFDGDLVQLESRVQRAIDEYRELIGFIVTLPDDGVEAAPPSIEHRNAG